jgi:hypothetical protein
MEAMQPWVEDELRTVDLPDKRLDKRLRVLLDRFSSKPTLSIPAACNGWAEAKAAYRFFDNEGVNPAKLLQPHYDATLERIRQQSVVLMPQDTTELELTRQQEKFGGPLGDENHWGLHDHLALAMTPERLVLGVAHSYTWARDLEDFHKRKEARYKPIEEKESYRWVQGYRRACMIAAEVPQTKIISIADSEADIYELFVEAASIEGAKAEWIVRACQDRSLTAPTAQTDETDEIARKLSEAVAAGSILGTLVIEVSGRPAQSHDGSKRRQAKSARTTTVTVQACRVSLQAPWRPNKKLPNLEVNAVLVREINPPAGEPPIEWLLLTSLSVATFSEACEVIHYYACRWEIEVFFRVLKSGCTVEKLQLETPERYGNCLAIYLIVAWRVLFLMRLGRECPDMPCEAVFTKEEWQAVYQIVQGKPAAAMPSLGAMMIMIAELGGYLNRKHDGPPGPQTIWIGMQRARDFATAWSVFNAFNGPSRIASSA